MCERDASAILAITYTPSYASNRCSQAILCSQPISVDDLCVRLRLRRGPQAPCVVARGGPSPHLGAQAVIVPQGGKSISIGHCTAGRTADTGDRDVAGGLGRGTAGSCLPVALWAGRTVPVVMQICSPRTGRLRGSGRDQQLLRQGRGGVHMHVHGHGSASPVGSGRCGGPVLRIQQRSMRVARSSKCRPVGPCSSAQDILMYM